MLVFVCLGGAEVRASDLAPAAASSTPGRGVIKSPRSTQPSIPPGYVNRVPALSAGVKMECVLLCRLAKMASNAKCDDPIWQVTPEVLRWVSREELIWL